MSKGARLIVVIDARPAKEGAEQFAQATQKIRTEAKLTEEEIKKKNEETFKKVMERLDAEIDRRKKGVEAGRVEAAFQDELLKIKQKGISLTDKEIEQLREKTKANQELANAISKGIRANNVNESEDVKSGRGGKRGSKIEQGIDEIALVKRQEQARAVYNDLRDVFDISTTSLLGFKESEKQTASETAYLVEKLTMVGLAFGGLFGAVGAGLGIIAGVAHWNAEAAKRTEELRQRLRAAQDDFQKILALSRQFGVASFDFGGASKAIEEQTNAVKELKERAKEAWVAVAAVKAADVTVSAQKWGAANRSAASGAEEAALAAKKQKLDEAAAAQQKLNEATLAYYDAAVTRGKEAEDQIAKAVAGQQYIGKQRPLQLVKDDAAAAQKKFDDLRTSVAASDTKIKEISEALKSGSALEVFRTGLKYKIDLTDPKKMQQLTEENIKGQGLLSSAISYLNSLLGEQRSIENDLAEKAKEKSDVLKNAAKSAREAVAALEAFKKGGEAAVTFEEAFASALGDRSESSFKALDIAKLKENIQARIDAQTQLKKLQESIEGAGKAQKQADADEAKRVDSKLNFFEALYAETEQQQKLADAIKVSTQEYEFQQKFLAKLNQAKSQGIELNEKQLDLVAEEIRKQQALAEGTKKISEATKETAKAQEQLAKEKSPLESLIAQYDLATTAAKNFQDVAVNGINSFASTLNDALWGTRVNWKEWGRDVAKELTEVAIKMALVAALKGALGIATGGTSFLGGGALLSLGSLVGLGNVFSLHSGGVAGRDGASRSVSPLAFMGAPRYHSGTYPGLRPDEIPAILQKGEVVLSRQQVQGAQEGGSVIQKNTFILPNVKDADSFEREMPRVLSRLKGLPRGR